MIHSFDIEIAAKVGTNAAVIYNNLLFWCTKNKANEENFYDGNYWTYNSNQALSKLFPYLTTSQIRSSLQKLLESGLIEKGNYGKNPYDRTLWYAVSSLAEEVEISEENDDASCDLTQTYICQKSQMYILDINKDINVYTSSPYSGDDSCSSSESYTEHVLSDEVEFEGQHSEEDQLSFEDKVSVNTPYYDNSTPRRRKKANQNLETETEDDFFERVWKIYPSKKGKSAVKKTQRKRLQKIGYEKIEAAIQRYVSTKEEWRSFKDGSTFFNSSYADFLEDVAEEVREEKDVEFIENY